MFLSKNESCVQVPKVKCRFVLEQCYRGPYNIFNSYILYKDIRLLRLKVSNIMILIEN